jgi:hypothetical protein
LIYRFHRAALTEHLDQVAFYESQLPGLGADYLGEFESTMVRICSNPKTYPNIEASALHKVGMRRFPFHVIYMIHKDQILVLAIAHYRRRPVYWTDRVGN